MKANVFALASVILESRFRPSRLFLILYPVFGLVVFLTPSLYVKVLAQQNSEPAATPPIAALKPSADDARYRIGPGDVLAILVRKAPELTMEAVRVDQRVL